MNIPEAVDICGFSIKTTETMAKVGDTVRFLNSTGGGKITRIEGRLAYVEENGFETPVLVSEVVVVLPAGQNPANSGARLMFDQKAFDEGRKKAPEPKPEPAPEPELPLVETERGENLNIVLGFEPADIKSLSKTRIGAVLVNDSNYFLSFVLLARNEEDHAWQTVYQGEVAPNELIDLASYTQDTIVGLERIVFQAIAYKKGKTFAVKSPVNVSKKLDLTKFYKLHCFRPGIYFDNPVIEVPLYSEKHR